MPALGFNSSISLVAEFESSGLGMVQIKEPRNFLFDYTFKTNQQFGMMPKRLQEL